jgi:hypothetical protein
VQGAGLCHANKLILLLNEFKYPEIFNMKTILEPQREIPVAYEAEVIVVGGGPAGIGAAVSAARNGANTILLERFGSLGGLQTQCFNASFSFVDHAIQGGIIQDVIYGLKKNRGLMMDTTRVARSPKGMGGIFFDVESYKFLLDNMVNEAGVKTMFHVFAADAIKNGNSLDGIIIESNEGRRAILGKVIIDTTGSADVAWKSGASCMDEGFPKGPKKGRHSGFGYTFYFGGVDYKKFKEFRKANPEQWGGLWGGKELVRKAKESGELYGNRAAFLLSEVWGRGSIWILGPQYALPMGHHGWLIEDQTEGEFDLRRQSWSSYELIRRNVPGFENAYIEKTPNVMMLRDTHRMIGEYVLTEDDIRQGKIFDDSIAISNMCPDVFGPDDEHEWIGDIALYDIPYRCLISKEMDNLMCAGSTMSTDFITWCATRYCTPSICTGQAAGTAAALSVQNNILPRNLDIKLLQDTLSRQGARISQKYVAESVINEYRNRAARAHERTINSNF